MEERCFREAVSFEHPGQRRRRSKSESTIGWGVCYSREQSPHIGKVQGGARWEGVDMAVSGELTIEKATTGRAGGSFLEWAGNPTAALQ